MVKCPTLALFCLLGAAPLAGADEPDLDELAKLYRELEMPMPPAKARLVRINDAAKGMSESGQSERVVWLIEQGDTRSVVLFAHQPFEFKGWQPSFRDADLAVWRSWAAKPGTMFMDPVDALDICLQLKLRGEVELATAALNWFTADQLHWRQEVLRAFPERDFEEVRWRDVLLMHVFEYWREEICRPNGDRAAALRALTRCSPMPNEIVEGERAELAEAIRLTIQGGKGEPGSVEADIDALTEACDEDYPGVVTRDLDMTVPECALASRGFRAIPALIAHLDDARVTRCLYPRVMMRPTMVLRVGDLARRILRHYADPELQALASPSPGDFQSWWERVRKVDEGAWLEARALSCMQGNAIPDNVVTEALASRYPRRLVQVYLRIVSQDASGFTSSAAARVGRCALPSEDRIAALRIGACSEFHVHRLAAREELARLDAEGCARMVLADIETLPATDSSSEAGERADEVSELAFILNRKDVWESLGKAVRLAAPGLRTHLVGSYGSLQQAAATVERQNGYLAFIRPLLDGGDRHSLALSVALSFRRWRNPPLDAPAEAWAEFAETLKAEIDRGLVR